MKKLAYSALALLAAAPAFANNTNALPPSEVPEISALDGVAALAVVSALVLLAWERRRRAA
ncbi:hypothetical protein SAMN05878503_1109 [Cereibacter ovatus]|uniref:VPEID-CTERM protein sorting domain-containing protein n=1 Tax=Cereibacter ovatus TaxID=439529 RepID=A0A285CVS6_9RHOB|nr:hypothetical protein [Cereibacter ovatus]SNX71515.1 hypothetical protein SAMN05878503_1109 [Cereibacter ovatus]